MGIIYTGFEVGNTNRNQPTIFLSFVLFLLIVIGYFLIKKHKNEYKLFKYLSLWAIVIPLVIAIISFYKPIFFPRYFIFCAVGFILLLILILEKLPLIIRNIVIIIFIVTTIRYIDIDLKVRQKADVRKTIYEIKQLADKNDAIYVTNELEFFDAQYYFAENRVYIYGKSYNEIPNYVGKVLMPESKLINSLPVYPKKAFILTSPDKYNIQAAF